MQLLKNTKLVGGLVVVAALLLVAYYYWGSPPAAAPLSEAEPVASQELLVMLGNLNSIKLDPALFSDPLFALLSDFGVVIPAQPVGRRNPFAPL